MQPATNSLSQGLNGATRSRELREDTGEFVMHHRIIRWDRGQGLGFSGGRLKVSDAGQRQGPVEAKQVAAIIVRQPGCPVQIGDGRGDPAEASLDARPTLVELTQDSPGLEPMGLLLVSALEAGYGPREPIHGFSRPDLGED